MEAHTMRLVKKLMLREARELRGTGASMALTIALSDVRSAQDQWALGMGLACRVVYRHILGYSGVGPDEDGVENLRVLLKPSRERFHSPCF